MSYNRIFGGSAPPSSKAVVITGGSRGLGYALASCFLAAGDRVLLTSRTAATAEAAAAQLAAEHHAEAHGAACDVRDWAQVHALAQTAVQRLGRIDIWINNAGASQVGKVPIVDTDPSTIKTILDTNLLGSMLGAKAALAVMTQQQGGGQVWLVDGSGARGNATPGNAAYGASKRALTQLLHSLAAECRAGACSVHMFSPGMVATNLLFSVRCRGCHSLTNMSTLRLLNHTGCDDTHQPPVYKHPRRAARGRGGLAGAPHQDHARQWALPEIPHAQGGGVAVAHCEVAPQPVSGRRETGVNVVAVFSFLFSCIIHTCFIIVQHAFSVLSLH